MASISLDKTSHLSSLQRPAESITLLAWKQKKTSTELSEKDHKLNCEEIFIYSIDSNTECKYL